MGKHSGEAAAETPAVDRSRLLKLAVGATLTLVSWGLLVWLAIDFGTEARSGSGIAWVLLVIATLGATACAFLGLLLGSKLLAVFRGDTTPVAPRPVGGKRAAR